MIQSYRGPLALTIAAVLLTGAVAAYLIGDLETNARRQEAALSDQEFLRDYRVKSSEIHSQFEHQVTTMAETRLRLDEVTKRLEEMRNELDSLKYRRLRVTPLNSEEE